MNIEEISKFLRYDYIEKCKCGKSHRVLTQKNADPEYQAEVYIYCDCGEYVEFILPVN